MDLSPIRYLSLFSGDGGLDLAVRVALPEACCVCRVENEIPVSRILASRIEKGVLDQAPQWSDVRTFEGQRWRGAVDLIVGGFPCTDLSVAGKRAGIHGAASGLWWEFARIIREVRPQFVFIENVPAVISVDADEPGTGPGPAVLGELDALGFDAEWLTLFAADVGAAQDRKRVFILAHARQPFGWWPENSTGVDRAWPSSHTGRTDEELGDSTQRGRRELRESPGRQGRQFNRTDAELEHAKRPEWWPERECGDSSDQGRNGARQTTSRSGVRSKTLGRSTDARHQEWQDDIQLRELAAAERAGYGLFPPGQGSWSPADPIPGKEGFQPGWIACVDGRAFRIATDADAAAWCEIVRKSPWLAPAIEPGLCELASGESVVVDQDRSDQLRALGNQVVALQGAVALVELARRSCQ